MACHWPVSALSVLRFVVFFGPPWPGTPQIHDLTGRDSEARLLCKKVPFVQFSAIWRPGTLFRPPKGRWANMQQI